MTAVDADNRPRYAQFPYKRPVHYVRVLVESGSTPRLNALPGFIPYIYRGTGRDTLTPWLGMHMSELCLTERCWQCHDAYCPCACEHPGGTT